VHHFSFPFALASKLASLPETKNALSGNSITLFCGERGIRTLVAHKAPNGFRDRPIQPLWHLSEACKNKTPAALRESSQKIKFL
jgi:hypothetical protein